MLRKLIEKLFWYYHEKENWRMKMDEPIKIVKISEDEAQKILDERRREKKHL